MSVVALERTGRGQRPAPEAKKDWEDEYRRLYEKHKELTVKYNESETARIQLRSKLQKVERDLVNMDRQNGGSGVKPVNTVRDRDDENLVSTMYEQNAKLKSQVTALKEKVKTITEELEKKKRELVAAKKRIPPTSGVATKVSDRPHSAPDVQIKAAPSRPFDIGGPDVNGARKGDENLLAIAQKLKERLNAAQEEIKQNQTEIARYRSGASGHSSGVGHAADLESQLRDTKWKLQQLQVQYDNLSSKSSTTGMTFRKHEEQLEDYAQRVRELKRTLEELKHEKELSDLKADRVVELEDLVRELRSSNRSLEENINRLCEAPFISEAYGQQENRHKSDELIRDRAELKSKVEHLQEAVKTNYSALVSMKEEAAALRSAKNEAERLMEEYRSKCQELEMGASVLQDKMRLFSGDEGLNVDDLERALTVVKKRGEAVKNLEFLEEVDEGVSETKELLKRKLQSVQIINLNLSKEVERLENMLRLQSSISKDLHKEVETLVRKMEREKSDFQKKAMEIESLSARRQEKIQSLEAVIRQHVYSTAKGGKSVGLLLDSKAAMRSAPAAADTVPEVQNDLLVELINEKDGDIRPDENLLEVWVKACTIQDRIVLPGSSTFVVIDFFDYESQATSLVSGSKPNWDFAATYKIIVDDFLLLYMATDSISFELNMATKGDFTMLARCNVPLRDLLKSKPRLSMDKYPMVSPQTGEVIAHLTFDARLAMPISELYRLFLERHPGQRKLIEDMSNKRFLEGKDAAVPASIGVEESKEDESRMYNELEILILKLSNLADVATDAKPSLYTYFQLLGYPEKFTNPVMNSVDPVFNEKFSFPMITNDHQMRLLERSPLHIIIMDLKKEEHDDPSSDGFVGEVTVSLAQLSDGLINNDTFSVRDRSGKKVADLDLSIRWKHPLRKQRELGPRALGAIDVECLMTAFSHGDLYTGLVDYKRFCRFINPPRSVKIAIDFLRKFVSKTSDKEGLGAKDVIRGITGNSHEMNEDEFLQKLLRIDSEILPSDYTALFRFIDVPKVGTVSVDQLIAILNLDEEVKIPAALLEKLFQRVHDLLTRSIVPVTLFESEDRWGVDGCISRAEFKHGLRKMGYQLVDDEEAPEGESLLINHQLQSDRAVPQRHELLDDTNISDGNDEILMPVGSHPEHHEMNGGGGVETSKAKILQDHQRSQIEFKQRMSELQARSQKAAANAAAERAISSDGVEHPSSTESPPNSRRASPFDNERMDHVDLNPGDFKQRHHSTTLANEDNGRREYDQIFLDQSATKLQSTFRGHISRKKDSSPPRGGPKKKAPLKVSEDGILIAEDSLRFQLESNGARVVVDLTKEFQIVDSRRSGVVNKKQFAFVLSKVPALKLEPNDLLVIMKYFDRSSDCTDIDYNAFLGFCKYRIPEKSNVLMILDQMIITDNNIEFMRTMDSNGSGFMRRADMLRALTNFGYGHFGKSDFLDMMALFETREEGLVNYLNFSEYVSENNMSRAFKDVENSLKAMFTQGSLLDWFKQIDSRNEGVIGVERFRDFLIGEGFEMSKEMIMAMISDMDTENSGVHFAQFKAWAAKVSRPHDIAFHGDLSNMELKSKAQKFISWINKRGPAAIDHILQCFLLYDWQKPPSGFVRKVEFYRACYRAGFVFTESELHKLSSQFSDDAHSKSVKVRYRDFLDWCMVNSKDVTGSDGVHQKRPVDQSRNLTSLIMRCLEHQIKKGVDLLSVFGRFDSKAVGRISADEFCSALADLGLSSVTQRDVLDFAEIFKAAPGSNFIMYRRIITELLQKFDENSGAADIDIVDSICNTLLKRRIQLTKLRGALEHYDSKLTGTIRSEDVGTAFEDLRVVLRRQEIEALCNRYSAGDIYRLQYHPLLADLQSKIGDEELPLVTQVPAEIVTKIRGSLETLIIKGVDYCSEFERVSESIDGRVSQAEFKEALLGRLKISLSSHEVQVLASSFRDEKDPRRVHFLKMLHVCHPLTRSAEDHTLWSISETLRHKIRRRCDFNVPGELRRPFSHFCKKSLRKITRESFAVGIRDIGIQLDTDQERDLFDTLARRKDAQTVTYSEFKVFVCDPFHRDVLWNFARAKKRAGVSERELVEAIKRMDTSDSGLITSQQCAKTLVKNGIELSDTDVNRLMVRFDSEEQQRFEITEFVKFVRGDDGEDVAGGDRSVHDRLKDDPETRRHGRRQDDEDDLDDSAVLLSLRRAVKKKLTEGYTANEIFSTFDPENRRALDLASLQSGAREYGISISRVEARTILRKMGLAAGGVVDKTSFLVSLGIEKDESDARRARRFDDDDDELRRRYEHRRPSESSPTELKRVVKSVHDQLCDRYGSSSSATRKANDAMEDVDHDNDGKITLKEFQESLYILKIELTKTEVVHLFEKLDSSESGKLRCDDFIDLVFKDADREITPPKSRARAKLDVRSIIEDIQDGIITELGPGAGSARQVKRIFSDIDLNDDGRIDKKEFLKAMQILKLPIGEREADVIFDKYDRDGNGRLNYSEFIDLIDFHAKLREKGERRRDSPPEDRATLSTVIRDIKEAIVEELGPGAHSAKTMKRVFADIDLDGNGAVDKFELAKAMKKLGVPVSESNIDILFEKFEKTRGYFDYTDFIHFLDFQSKDEVADVLKDIQDGVRDYLGPGAESAREMKRVFADFDVDGNGTVDKREFAKALKSLKIPVGEETVDKIYAVYDTQGKGKLNYTEFISLLDFRQKEHSRNDIDSETRRDSRDRSSDARK